NRYSKKKIRQKSLHCFNELVINAIEHGSNNEIKKKILVKIVFDINSIHFTIKDEGMGFNWKDYKKNNFKKLNNRQRGMGLFLVNYFSSYLNFNEKGNEVMCGISC
ncbi:MAG: ATP-binding protein, partial [Spirochaetes bacterium]|nr:ATP-binding protein [Spirochaetota bacterium]